MYIYIYMEGEERAGDQEHQRRLPATRRRA